MNEILFGKDGKLRSGWRAATFLFAFVLTWLIFVIAAQAILIAAGYDPLEMTAPFMAVNALASLMPAIGVGWLCGKFLERLPFRALGATFTPGWFRHLILGLVIGAMTLLVAVLICFISGRLQFKASAESMSSLASSLVAAFLVFALAAAFEEAFFRGYILQTFARSGLVWLAVLLTSIFFGAVHLNNPDATVISIINTILAGIWFSIAYLKTRDLWFVFGLHTIWNWIQGAVFGIEVSGLTHLVSSPLLKEIDSGPSWLTGADYGIEGGVAGTIALIVSSLTIWYLPIKPDPELRALTQSVS